MSDIRGTTRLVGLIGWPVVHSLSPQMHNAAFAALELDWAYVPLPTPPEQLADAVRGLAALGFAGANVTSPHKLAVAALCETDAPSVNTLVVTDGRIEGRTTDAAVLAGLPSESPVIVGDGGAATAFREALPHARCFSRRGDWPPDTGDRYPRCAQFSADLPAIGSLFDRVLFVNGQTSGRLLARCRRVRIVDVTTIQQVKEYLRGRGLEVIP